MSDYRFQIVDHNGLESLHVMIDGEDGETHIPIDDIQVAISRYQQEYHSASEDNRVSSGKERTLALAFQDTLENEDYLFKTENGSLIKEFSEGDWLGFWTGGTIRRFIYKHMKHFLRGCDRWFDSLDI